MNGASVCTVPAPSIPGLGLPAVTAPLSTEAAPPWATFSAVVRAGRATMPLSVWDVPPARRPLLSLVCYGVSGIDKMKLRT
jgi:hypothetical protein